MSSSTLGEARAALRSFDTEIAAYRQEVTRITSGPALQIDFGRLESFQAELLTLNNRCRGWINRLESLKSSLRKKEDRSDYNEAVSLIGALNSQSATLVQLKDFFALTASSASQTEGRALRQMEDLAWVGTNVAVRAGAQGAATPAQGASAARFGAEMSAGENADRPGGTVMDRFRAGLEQLSEVMMQLSITSMRKEMEAYGYPLPVILQTALDEQYLAMLEAYMEMVEAEALKLYNRLVVTDRSGNTRVDWALAEELLWKDDLNAVELNALMKMFLEMDEADGRAVGENMELFFMCAYRTERDPETGQTYMVASPNLEALSSYGQQTLMPNFSAGLYQLRQQDPDAQRHSAEVALKENLSKLALLNDVASQVPQRITVGTWETEGFLSGIEEGTSYLQITRDYLVRHGMDVDEHVNDVPVVTITWPADEEGVAYTLDATTSLNYNHDTPIGSAFTYTRGIFNVKVYGVNIAGIDYASSARGTQSATSAMNNLVLESLKPDRGSAAEEVGKFAAGQVVDKMVGGLFEAALGPAAWVGELAKDGVEEIIDYMQDMETLDQIEGAMGVNDYLKRVALIGGSCQISVVDDKPYVQYSYYRSGTFEVIADAYWESKGIRLTAREVERIVFVDSLTEEFGGREKDFYKWLTDETGEDAIANQWAKRIEGGEGA